MNSNATIYRRLINDSLITFEAAEYLGRPAIFDDAAPDDFVLAEGLLVIISPPTSVDPDPTFTEQAWAIRQDVRVYAKHTGSNARLDVLANHVRDLFHLKAAELDATPDTVEIATATGPVASPTSDQSIVGRRVSLRLTIKEN